MDQGLPVNFENTASTWQNMPGLAAFYTGLQNQAAQDNIRMLQQAFAEEQAFKGQTRPLEVEKIRGLNELQAAQAMETRARGRQTGLASDLAAATMSGTITATNSKNDTSVTKNEAEAGAAQAAVYNQLAGWLKGEGSMIPPMEQVRVVMDKLKLQDTPDRRVSTGLLQNVNKLPEILAAQYDHMVKTSREYQQQQLQETGANKRNAATNATSIEVANINAKRALDVQAAKNSDTAASIEKAVLSKKFTAENAAVAYGVLASTESDPEKAAEYRKQAALYEQLMMNKPQAPNIGKTDTAGAAGLPVKKVTPVFGEKPAPGSVIKYDLNGNRIP